MWEAFHVAEAPRSMYTHAEIFEKAQLLVLLSVRSSFFSLWYQGAVFIALLLFAVPVDLHPAVSVRYSNHRVPVNA